MRRPSKMVVESRTAFRTNATGALTNERVHLHLDLVTSAFQPGSDSSRARPMALCKPMYPPPSKLHDTCCSADAVLASWTRVGPERPWLTLEPRSEITSLQLVALPTVATRKTSTSCEPALSICCKHVGKTSASSCSIAEVPGTSWPSGFAAGCPWH